MSVLGVIATPIRCCFCGVDLGVIVVVRRPGPCVMREPGAVRGFHGSWLEEQINREQGAPTQHVMCEACDQKSP